MSVRKDDEKQQLERRNATTDLMRRAEDEPWEHLRIQNSWVMLIFSK